MKKLLLPTFLLALLLAGIPLHCPRVMAHGSHEHGVAHMNVSVEGKTVYVEFESPLANVLAFEHKAVTEQENNAVNEMAATLKKPGAIAVFDADAQCRQKKFEMASAVLEDATLFPGGPASAGENRHRRGEEHGDITIEMEFTCDKPDLLHSLSTPLFVSFPALREIRMQMVTLTGQHSAELTPQSSTARW